MTDPAKIAEGLTERCETCRFSVKQFDDVVTLRCRRFPPSEPSKVTLAWNQPLVCNGDWCGEYQREKPNG